MFTSLVSLMGFILDTESLNECYVRTALRHLPKVLGVWEGPCCLKTSQYYSICMKDVQEDPGNYKRDSPILSSYILSTSGRHLKNSAVNIGSQR